jgi:hypothetical protein
VLSELAPARPSYLPPGPVDLALLETLVARAYSPGSGSVLRHGDLPAAAAALLVLWRAQWPQLRARFAFRTREVARTHPSPYVLTVTAKLRDSHASEDGAVAELSGAGAPAWVKAVVADAASGPVTPLRRFLWTFGPQESTDLRRLRRLAALWVRVDAGDAAGARTLLERFWPRPRSGAALKRALFGAGECIWWDLDERTRVATLLAAARPAWDLDELNLAARTHALRERAPAA